VAAAAEAAVRDVKAAPLFLALASATASFALLVDAAAVAALAAKQASVEAEAAAHGFCTAAAPRPHAPPFAPKTSATPLTEIDEAVTLLASDE
jgi:hypothetical protein